MLSDIVRELQKTRDDNLPHMNNINTLSDKIVNEEKLTSSNRVSMAVTDALRGRAVPHQPSKLSLMVLVKFI